jgi:hypothetical protein
MRMAVPKRRVVVGMRVRLGPLIAAVGMPVMLVVHVAVLVLHRLVLVLVTVLLTKGKPRRCGRECKPGHENRGQRLAEKHDRERGAKKRRGPEMGGGARRAEVPLGEHIQH